MKCRHIDAFSGIGGFALAADRVFGNIEHLFIENDPFCRKVLKKHWPKAEIHGDIREFITDAESKLEHKLAVERKQNKETTEPIGDYFLLTGGFPCQPFSHAGRRGGTADDRYLWPEMFRVIQLTNPKWVIAENVSGLVSWNAGLVFEQVCLDLEGQGYEVQAFVIPAVAVNAPHRRDRVWVIAHKPSSGLQRREFSKDEGENERRVSGGRSGGLTPNAGRKRRSEGKQQGLRPESKEPKWPDGSLSDWKRNWSEVAASLCRVDDGIPRRVDRAKRIKALGNAIVPQVAEEIMRAIIKTEENDN